MPTSHINNPAALFPADYATARQLWLNMMVACDLPKGTRSFPLTSTGPNGESLATDCAWLGNTNADNVLVIIGGTHGIEGYAGSAVEYDFLQQHDSLPQQTAVLLVHALNAWGYAWSRRCDEEGIDINRNFVDFHQPLPGNPGYLELRDALFDDNTSSRQQALDAYREKQRVA